MPVVPKVTRSRSSTPDQDSDGSTLYNGESGQYESASTMDYNSPSIKLNNHSKPSNRWSSSVVSEVSSSDRRTEEIPVSLPKWSGYQTAAKESLSPSKPQTLKKSNLKKDKGDIEAWLDKYNRENGGGAPLKPIQEDEDAPLFAIKQKITKNRKEIQSMVDSTTKSDEEEQPLEMVQRRLSKRKDISFSKTRHIVSYDRASDIASESDFGGSASGTGPRRVHSLPAPIRTHLNENDGSGEDGTMDRVLRPLSTEVPRLSLALPKPREKVYKLAPVPAVNLQDLSPDLSKLDLTRSEDFIVAMDNSIEYEHQQQGEVEDRNRSSTTLKSQVSSAKGSILSSEFPFRDSQSGQVDRSNLWTWFCTSQREYDLTNFTRSKVVSSDMLLVIRANAFLYAVLILSLVCIEFPYKQLLVRFDFLFWVGLVAYLFYTLVISFIYYRETKRLERPPLPGPVKGIWLVLYALSSTFCLVTLSLWIVTLILPRFPKPPPSDTYVWFLTINLNVVGLVIMTLETVLSRVPLDKAQGSVWTMVFALLYIGWVFLANSNALNFSYVPSPFEIIGGTYTAVAWTSFVVVGAGAFALSLAVHALRGNLRANAKVLR